MRVDRLVGHIQAAKGMQRLGVVRPLLERALERTRLCRSSRHEVVVVGTRAG